MKLIWRQPTQRAVWAGLVVVALEPTATRLRVLNACEEFTVEQLVAQGAVEALSEPVLPRRAWLDVLRLDAHDLQPLLRACGDQLGAVVHADCLWPTVLAHGDRQVIDHAQVAHPERGVQGDALARVLVDGGEHAKRPVVFKRVMHEVNAPDFILGKHLRDCRGRRVVSGNSTLLWRGSMAETALAPDALHPLVVDRESFEPQM